MELEVWSYWYIASMALLLLEALAMPGVGLFFAAISALCLGALTQSGVIAADDSLTQGTVFFFLTALWAVVLWKPLKRMRLSKSPQSHHDMIGRSAYVTGGALEKGTKGTAKWSGTIMTARLAKDAGIEAAAEGTELKIVDVQNATLILAELDYAISTPEQ